MAQEPRLGLPYISASQAQKEVTHNEAILMLGRLVQASVKEMRQTEPGSPADGDGYIIATGSPGLSGDFIGHADELAYWNGTAWEFLDPPIGCLVYVEDLRAYWAWDGSDWVEAIALP